MKIAIVNLITKTVHSSNILPGSCLRPIIETDEEINIVELGKELSRLGQETTIYASDVFLPIKSVSNEILHLSVKYLPTILTKIFAFSYFPFTPSLYSELHKNKFDVIQSGEFFQMGTIISAISAIQRNVPIVVWHELGVQQRFPGNLFQELYVRTIGKFVLRRICWLIPRSHAAKDWLISKRIPSNKIWEVVHTGVNTERFYPLRNNLKIKHTLGIPVDNVLIVSVGRLHASKGFEHLIRSIKQVVDRYPNVSLIIRGYGPEAPRLKNLIETIELQKHITIISKNLSTVELNELYNASDFTVLPSTKELFPNFTIIESLACGKPVIHSSPGGERDLGGNGYASFYVKYGDVKALTNTILFLIDHPEIRAEMGRNAFKLLQKEYDLKIIALKLLRVYESAKKT